MSDMLSASAVQEIAELAQKAQGIDDLTLDLREQGYGLLATRELRRVDPFEPLPQGLAVTTLTAVVDFVRNENPQDAFAHISHDSVSIIGKPRGTMLKRPEHLHAVAVRPDIRFGRWLATEVMLIELLTLYQQNDGLMDTLRLIGNMKAEAVKTQVDDGFTQEVTVRTTAAIVDKQGIKNPVLLRPYRTFREVDQPETEYVLRVRKTATDIEVALFEADGGRWRVEAINAVRAWLEKNSVGIPIVG